MQNALAHIGPPPDNSKRSWSWNGRKYTSWGTEPERRHHRQWNVQVASHREEVNRMIHEAVVEALEDAHLTMDDVGACWNVELFEMVTNPIWRPRQRRNGANRVSASRPAATGAAGAPRTTSSRRGLRRRARHRIRETQEATPPAASRTWPTRCGARASRPVRSRADSQAINLGRAPSSPQ